MSVPAQTQLRSFSTLLFTLIKDSFAIGFLREQGVINDARDLVCGGSDGGGCTQFRSHATEELAEIALGAAKGVRA